MTWIDGNMVLTEKVLVFDFERENDPVEYQPGDYSCFDVTIRNPETGELESIHQSLVYGGNHATISPFTQEPRKFWRIEIYPFEGETYQNMRKRLILTWDRVIRLNREELRELVRGHEIKNGHWGTPIIPYKEPNVEVDE